MFSKQSVETTCIHAISSNSRKGYVNMVFELFGFHEPGDFKDQIAAIRMVS